MSNKAQTVKVGFSNYLKVKPRGNSMKTTSQSFKTTKKGHKVGFPLLSLNRMTFSTFLHFFSD